MSLWLNVRNKCFCSTKYCKYGFELTNTIFCFVASSSCKLYSDSHSYNHVIMQQGVSAEGSPILSNPWLLRRALGKCCVVDETCDVSIMFSSRRVLQTQLRLLRNKPLLPCRYTLRPSRNTSTAAHEPIPQPSRWPRRLAYIAIFGSLGIAAGKWMDRKLTPPPFPDTEEDREKLEEIRYIYEHGLPIVKELRENPDYIEADVYGNYSKEDKLQRLSSGALRGSRGLAFQVSSHCGSSRYLSGHLCNLAHG